MPFAAVNSSPDARRRALRSARLRAIAGRLLSRPEQYPRGRRAAYVAVLYDHPGIDEASIRAADRALRGGAR